MRPSTRRALAFLIASYLLVPSPRACAEPYCGLYAIHAALHSLGLEADFHEMVVPAFLSGDNGSTALDLMQLASKYGASATYRTRMTMANLRAATSPVVLHTSVAVSKSGFHHWVLFLGMAGDSVQIYDPPKGRYVISGAELLSHWDGVGVVVRRTNDRPWAPVLDYELLFAVLLVLVIGAAVLRYGVLTRVPACGILLVAAVSATTWHVVVEHGYLRNPSALAAVASRFERDRLPFVTASQLRALVGRRDVTVVDARTPDSYRRAHIKGALNLPVSVTHGELRRALAGIPSGNHVIVYCQSDKCEWSDAIAYQFPARGYRRVSIFRGGMDAWQTPSLTATGER